MSTREKNILLSIPFLLAVLLYLNKDYFIELLDLNKEGDTQQVIYYTNLIHKLKNKRKLEDIEILGLYDKVVKKSGVKIVDIVLKNKYIEMNTLGDFENSMEFLWHMEKINEIIYLHLSSKGKKLHINLILNITDTYTYRDIFTNVEVKNPFSNDEKKMKRNDTIAIVGQYIFYNDKWIGISDEYKGKQIISIGKNSIQLKDINGTISQEYLSEK